MNHDQLNRSIQQLLEGSINQCELTLLESELANNAQARELYIDLAEIHSFLDNSDPVAPLQGNIVPMERIVRRQKRRNLRIALGAAAAIVLIGLVAMQLFFVPPPKEQLRFTTAPGTQFELTHPASDGDVPQGFVMLPGSELKITQGTIELDFKSGVKSIVMAPAEFSLNQAGEVEMPQGTAWFNVPEEAIGFTINTEELKVVDLGTKFGVISTPGIPDQVHVFKGKVEVTSHLSDNPIILTADRALQAEKSGSLREIDLSPASFLSELPSSLPYLHWSFNGNGYDQFVVDGNLPSTEDIFTETKSDDKPQFTPTAGKFGNALSLKGYNTIQTTWYGITGNAPRTVAFWIKLPKGITMHSSILGWGKRDDQNMYSSTRDFYIFAKNREVGEESKMVTGLSIGGYWVTGFSNIADDQWHHIAYVYTGKDSYDEEPEILCYIDGEIEDLSTHHYNEVATDNGLKNIVNTAGKHSGGSPLWMFGHHWGWEAFENVERSLDELFIFQGALKQSDIQRLYKSNTQPSASQKNTFRVSH